MDSYLANRPKLPASEHMESMDPSEGLAFRDPMEGMDNFMANLPQTGGFQSLRSALLEAGSVVDASEVNRRKEAAAGTHGQHGEHEHLAEPTVELITQNGRIEKVIVTCSCSRRIELDCTY